VRLTIDATDLRYADSASLRALVLAAEKIRTGDGTVTLLNPQPPVARLIELLCVDGMLSVERRNPDKTQPDVPARRSQGRPAPGPARDARLPDQAGSRAIPPSP